MTENNEPSASSIVEKYVGGGWDALSKEAEDQTQRDNLAAVTAQYEIAKDYIPCFASPAGAAVLEDLLNRTLRRSTWDATQGMDQATAAGLFREGQNAIVTDIIGMMKAAGEGPPQIPTKPSET